MSQGPLAQAAERAGRMVIAARQAVVALEAASRQPHDRRADSLIAVLLERARQVLGEGEELSRRIGAARRSLEREELTAPVLEAAPVEPTAPATADASTKPGGSGPSEGVRLLVSQLVAAGASRLEIENRLRQLGIRDAAQVVTGILDERAE